MIMDYESIAAGIKAEVELLAGMPVNDMELDIYKSQVLDSINVLALIVFLEREFAISINPLELDLSDLSTIRKMADYVYRKKQEPA